MGLGGTCAVEERMRFVVAVEEQQESFAAICRRFSVSRKTGYKWLERYEEAGIDGLSDRSRAPHHHPHGIGEKVFEQCLEVRRKHPTWGPVKVRPICDGGILARSGRWQARSAACSIAKD